MCVRVNFGCGSVFILSAALLVACGGGGGGYSSPASMSTPPPPAMPTVSFTGSVPAINFGRAVDLTWSSTNATSCSASSSGSGGSAFSGSQATSGTMTIAPTQPGDVTFTLTCTGTGGSASANVPLTVNPSILMTLSVPGITQIGSTVDPLIGDDNPYGLTIAPATAGLITQGDLIVCNFNEVGTNAPQGTGTTIVGLHPTAGATPYRIAQSADLLGCNALAMLPDDSISAAAQGENANPLVTAAGVVNTPFSSDTFSQPWGEAFVGANGNNPAALYVSNIGGSIDRITLNGDVQTAFTEIASGFCGSGSAGMFYAPAGLTYDPSIDTLYIVDTSSNSVVAFANVSSIGAAGIVVNGQCSSVTAPPTPAPTFSGPSAASARVIATGGAFFTPLSAALLSDGDLIVEDADINIGSQTPNLVFEISPVLPGGFVGQPVQLDSGNSGALFGIAATVVNDQQVVYFNDDNASAVMMITTGTGSSGTSTPPGY